MMDFTETEKVNQFSEMCHTAREFGQSVRELEDAGNFAERKTCRQQWRAWADSLPGNWRLAAVDAYYDEYSREPAEREYQSKIEDVEQSCSEMMAVPIHRYNIADCQEYVGFARLFVESGRRCLIIEPDVKGQIHEIVLKIDRLS